MYMTLYVYMYVRIDTMAISLYYCTCHDIVIVESIDIDKFCYTISCNSIWHQANTPIKLHT